MYSSTIKFQEFECSEAYDGEDFEFSEAYDGEFQKDEENFEFSEAYDGTPTMEKEEDNSTTPLVAPIPCNQPSFKGQHVITMPGVRKLGSGSNTLLFALNVLNDSQLQNYLKNATLIQRVSGRSGFGQKPRLEMCYSADGSAYKYSRVFHPTMKYPSHVLDVASILLEKVNTLLSAENISNPFQKLSNGVDILYSEQFARGGSISAHRDDEEQWGLVIIFSLGQTRWLRVRSNNKEWWNIKMGHNSLIAMHGKTFQSDFTHQVDKLQPGEIVGRRLSLNLRFAE